MTEYRLAELPPRIAAKIHVNPVTGCWEWQGALAGGGYGKIKWDGRNQVVHRVVFILLAGPIPSDRPYLDHVKARGCQSRICCWPAHLEPVTRAENDGRRVYPPHCPAGHEYTPENTYRNPQGCRNCRECGRDRSRRRWARNRKPGTPPRRSERTHCPAGHEYTPENTWREANGYRHCRTCNRDRQRARRILARAGDGPDSAQVGD
jgi:hypothetical protein